MHTIEISDEALQVFSSMYENATGVVLTHDTAMQLATELVAVVALTQPCKT